MRAFYCSKCLTRVACLNDKARDLNLVVISLLASKCQDFKLRGLQFHFSKQLKNGHSNFEASEDIKTKFKPQALHIMKFKY